LKTLARNNTKKHSKTQGNQYQIHFYESARDKKEHQQKARGRAREPNYKIDGRSAHLIIYLCLKFKVCAWANQLRRRCWLAATAC